MDRKRQRLKTSSDSLFTIAAFIFIGAAFLAVFSSASVTLIVSFFAFLLIIHLIIRFVEKRAKERNKRFVSRRKRSWSAEERSRPTPQSKAFGFTFILMAFFGIAACVIAVLIRAGIL